MTSDGAPDVIVFWSTAPWWTRGTFFAAGEDVTTLLTRPENDLSVAPEAVRGCLGVGASEAVLGESVWGGAGTTGAGCTPLLWLIVLVEDPGATLAEGVSLSLIIVSSSGGVIPLLLVLNQSITFFALLVEAKFELTPTSVLEMLENLGRGVEGTAECGGTSEGPTFSLIASLGGASVDGVRAFVFDLRNGSTITVKVFRLFFFDEVALASEELTGLNNDGDCARAEAGGCDGTTCRVEGRLAGTTLALSGAASAGGEEREVPLTLTPFACGCCSVFPPNIFPRPILSMESPFLCFEDGVPLEIDPK